MAYIAEHQKQLNGKGAIPVPGRTKGSRDCGPRSWSMGVDYVTRGQVVPSIRSIRDRGDVPGPQSTNVDDCVKAVESYRAIRGRKPLRAYKKSYIGDVKAAVKAGKYVLCCILYDKFNRVMGKTGDPNFNGPKSGHSIGVQGQRVIAGIVQWRIFDPLDDHRRPELSQKGPRWVDRDDVIVSMEALAKAKGRCYAVVFGGGGKKS
jgi:hypothetical protein